MKSGTLYGIWLVARSFYFLALFLTAGFVATMLREKRRRIGAPGLINPLPNLSGGVMPEMERQGKRTVWIATMSLMLGLILGAGLGYGSREHQLAGNTVTYTAVAIHPPSQPNTDFDIQPVRMQPIPSKICKSIVDWKYGEVLKDLTFEQEHGCKRVISYHRYPQGEKLNAAIQMR